jgi:hypothetical protein
MRKNYNPQPAEAQVAANQDAFLITSQEQLQCYNKDRTKELQIVVSLNI